jgi:metal iron transporter
MNCPIRTDPAPDEGHNQNPPEHANEITTNNTLNHRRNSTSSRNTRIHLDDGSHGSIGEDKLIVEERGASPGAKNAEDVQADAQEEKQGEKSGNTTWIREGAPPLNGDHSWFGGKAHKLKKVLFKYSKFIGPGFMVSVAYIDPGRYSSRTIIISKTLMKSSNRKLCH